MVGSGKREKQTTVAPLEREEKKKKQYPHCSFSLFSLSRRGGKRKGLMRNRRTEGEICVRKR